MNSSHDQETPEVKNDPKSFFFTLRLAFATALLLICPASPTPAAITWTGDLDPTNPAAWTSSTEGYIGKSSTGTITVDNASALLSYLGYLGYNSGSSGTATVTGAGSKWNSDYLYIGHYSNGTLNIEAGGLVSNYKGILGNEAGSSGTATVTGTGSKWTNRGELCVGDEGTGTLNIEAGGQISNTSGYIGGHNSGSTGTVTVTGAGSMWTNRSNLYVGRSGSGTLTVKDGGTVVVGGVIYASLNSLFGNGMITANGAVLDADLVFDAAHGSQNTSIFGSGGTLTITPSANNPLGVGYKGNGTLRITEGVNVASSTSSLGYNSGSSGTVTVTGAGSKWTSSYLNIGLQGTGTLNIKAGGQVSNTNGYIGRSSGSSGSVTVTGTGSKWTNSSVLDVGSFGTGTLIIEAGGLVSNTSGYLGHYSGSSGTVTVTGAGATWTNSADLHVGYAGSGTLTVNDGGTVVVGKSIYASLNSLLGNGTISANGGMLDADLVFDAAHGSQTTSIFGSGGTLTITPSASNPLGVGYKDTGTLRITQGVSVASSSGYLGNNSGSSGTATVTGTGSKWTNSGELLVGYSGTGKLNIGSGIASDGMVFAKSVTMANSSSATAICNLNGGTLQAATITKGTGTASFNWSDGMIRNYDTSTNLTISGSNSLNLKLAATGTHVFFIDSGRTGTVSAILSDATSGGTLAKQGGGLLTLSAANTYTGGTTISEGTLALNSSGSLASSSIDVKSGATFDVSAKSGYSLAAGKTLTGDGTIVGDLSVSGIHAPGNSTGVETVRGNYSLLGELQIELAGTAAGSGYDQVLLSGSGVFSAALGGTLALDWTAFTDSTDATQLWILKNDTSGTLSGTFGNYATNGAPLGDHDGRPWYLYYNADSATGNLTGGNDVVITPVPEPSSLILLALATLALKVGWVKRSDDPP